MEPASQKDYTWQQIGESVEIYSRMLLDFLGSKPESESIAFLCKNSLDMALLDLACLTKVNIFIFIYEYIVVGFSYHN